MSFRPRLSAVLLTVNLAVIAVPIGSIFFFRIYENQLVQETERELISQAALIGAMYRQMLLGSASEPGTAAAEARALQRGLGERVETIDRPGQTGRDRGTIRRST